MASRSTSTAVGLALALVATAALGGCSLFATPDPPPAVVTAVAEALAGFRATEGVAEATGYASPIDSAWGGSALEDPDAWIARFTITAEPRASDIETLADDIDETLSVARDTVMSAADLTIEADGTTASAHLEFSVAPTGITVGEMVATAMQLREIEGAVRVYVSTYPTPSSLVVAAPEEWADAAAALRALPGFGAGALRAVSVTSPLTDDDSLDGGVTLDPLSPSPTFIAAFAELAGTTGVRTADLNGVRPFDLADEAGTWRPSLSLWTGTAKPVEGLVAKLVALPDATSAVAGIPRARFMVGGNEPGDMVSGFVGLPVGAETPADGVPTPSATSDPPPVDPELAAARLEDGRVLVSSLLDEAGDLSGIRGTSALETAPCADDRGAQVRGSVVVPIFEIADSADAAFARITQAWTGRGFEYTDRAMGTDAYAAPGLESLTIRGTADGIRIIATAECTVRE